MTSKLQVSLCAIVRDITKERKLRFEKTLKQMAPYTNQIIVGVSDQTTDDSKEIIEEILASLGIPHEVYTTQWNHNFSDQLNNLTARAKSDWIIRLHQDRRYSLEDLPLLRPTIEQAEAEGKKVIRVKEIHYHDRTNRSRPEFIFKRGLQFAGIHCENLVKVPEKDTGNIDDHCVTPDEITFSEITLLHETLPNEGNASATYRKQLTEQELIRLSVIRDNASTAAEHYLLGIRYFILAISEQQNTLSEAQRQAKIAATIEPNHPAPEILLGDCQKKSGYYASAATHYEMAVDKGSAIAREKLRRINAMAEFAS